MVHRYGNIIPYNHNRVILGSPIKQCDYINASWIKNEDAGSSGLPTFIAAQGPFIHTAHHFLQMLVENNVKVVVMLTKLNETGEGQENIFYFQLSCYNEQILLFTVKNSPQK